MQIISENISDDHVITFQASEHFKGLYSRKPQRYRVVHGVISIQRLITQEGEKIQKNKRYHCFQNTSISQRRTSQMIRRSPTAYESRICVLTTTLRKIFLVFQLGEVRRFSRCPEPFIPWSPEAPGLETFEAIDFE